MTVELLTEHHLEFLSFKAGCTGLSEATLSLVKMPHCGSYTLDYKEVSFQDSRYMQDEILYFSKIHAFGPCYTKIHVVTNS